MDLNAENFWLNGVEFLLRLMVPQEQSLLALSGNMAGILVILLISVLG